MKIVQINGFRGIVMAGFIITCLFAGFVIFPGYVGMTLWNKYLVNLLSFPALNLFQGTLLWGMVAVSYYIITNGRMPVSFDTPESLSDAELSMIMKKAKINSEMRKINQIIKNSDKFEKENVQKADNTLMTSPLGNSKKDDDENIKIIK